MDDTIIIIDGKKFKKVRAYHTQEEADLVAEGIRKTGKLARVRKMDTEWGRLTGMFRVYYH